MKKHVGLSAWLAVLLMGHLGCVSGSPTGVRGEELFPDREFMKAHSRVFFKQVNLQFPPISRVEFFVRSETYGSAYLHLSDFASRTEGFRRWIPVFADRQKEVVELFRQNFKGGLRLENYGSVRLEMGLRDRPLVFYALLIYTLCEDYRENALSARDAFAAWNVLLALTKEYYGSGGGLSVAERAWVLRNAGTLVFFRDAPRWSRRAEKLARQLPGAPRAEDTIGF